MDKVFDVTNYATNLDSVFCAHAREADACQMAAYMKNKFAFYGLKKPLRTALFKSFSQINGSPPCFAIGDIVRSLWEMPHREMQYVAMELLYKNRKHINPDSIFLYAYLITEKSWWDTVDLLASKMLGLYFQRFPEKIEDITSDWMASENMWLKRSCILFQLHFKEKTDFPLLASFIEPCKTSNEFFLQKAIGWALREYAKTAPEKVRDYVEKAELKPLSKREALKHL